MKRVLIAACLLATTLHADEVFLRGGGRVQGIVVEQTDSRVVVDVGAGRVGLPRDRVERIVTGRTALAAYQERAAGLAPEDAKGWLELGLWARDRDLQTQAREAFERVVALAPDDATAQAALGNVLLDGAWVSEAESYRARGYVPFEGSWISPAERESILAQRREESAAQLARVEADARVREAEARARVAEAEAARAEADAEAASEGGIPIGWGGWGWTGFVPAPVSPRSRHHDEPHARCHSCAPPPGPRPQPGPSPRSQAAPKKTGSARLPH